MHADGLIAWFGVNASGFDDLLALVADRPAAMTLHTSASLGDVIAQLEAGLWPGVELGVGPLPGPASGGLAGGGGWWMLDRGDPAQVAAAWAVGSALMEPARLAELAAATGYVPPRRSVLDQPLLQERWRQYPQLRVAYDQLEAVSVDPGRVGLQVGPRPQIQRVLEIATSLMVTGEMDASDQLRQAELRAWSCWRSTNVHSLPDQVADDPSGRHALPAVGDAGVPRVRSCTAPELQLACHGEVDVVGAPHPIAATDASPAERVVGDQRGRESRPVDVVAVVHEVERTEHDRVVVLLPRAQLGGRDDDEGTTEADGRGDDAQGCPVHG
jgi:hypothetical protein